MYILGSRSVLVDNKIYNKIVDHNKKILNIYGILVNETLIITTCIHLLLKKGLYKNKYFSL